jgi:hypothetical protein
MANVRAHSLRAAVQTSILCIGLGAGLALAGGCSSSDDEGDDPGAQGGSAGSAGSSGASGSTATGGSGGSTGATGGSGGVVNELCGDGCQCSNGVDDDGDGKIDGLDEECTGPADNDEGSFATGIPGDNRDPKWQDCFYDGNSGAGDDHCRYATECLTGELPQTDPDCVITKACLDFCRARTPNGCDCFGCCAVTQSDGTTIHVALQASCSIETIADETKCPRCTPTDQCTNECGRCELCPGRTVADLPADCAPDGGIGYECEGGITCGPDLPCPEPARQYCELGCCLDAIF